MAHRPGTLGHFLPYLLGRQLRAVLWPTDGAGRAAVLVLGALAALYGASFGYLLTRAPTGPADVLGPKLLPGLYATLFGSLLLVDFLPTYRPVRPPLPEPLPVSAQLAVVTAALLDLVTLRRLLLLLFLVVALLVAPGARAALGLGLGIWLSAAAVGFNLRLLFTLGRAAHPLVGLNLLALLAAAAWLSGGFGLPAAGAPTLLAALAVAGPLVLWIIALVLVGPYFSARYLPVAAEAGTGSGRAWLARLSPEWKAYLRKTRTALLVGLGFKLLIVVVGALLPAEHKGFTRSLFYFVFLPVISFTYVNNNLFGYLWALTLNDLERLGLTARLLRHYLRLVGPIVLLDCLLSAVLLLALYPRAQWPLLGLLPLAAGALLAVGLWGSIYKAKPVFKTVDLGTMRNNASTLLNIITIVLAAALFMMPWWWARVALAAAVTLSAIVPVRRVLANHAPTRRRLWWAVSNQQ